MDLWVKPSSKGENNNDKKKEIHSLTSNPNIDLICFRLTSGGWETCPASKSFLCWMNRAARAEGAERLRVIRPNQYHEAKQFNKKGRRERERKKKITLQHIPCRSEPGNSVAAALIPTPSWHGASHFHINRISSETQAEGSNVSERTNLNIGHQKQC